MGESRASTGLWPLLVLGTILLGLSLVATGAHAQRWKKGKEKKEKQSYVVSGWVFERLSRATEAIQEERWDDALEALGEIADRGKKVTDYERALMWQHYGFVYAGQGKTKEATEAFAKCLETKALPEGAHLSTLFTLGQLHVAREDYAKGLEILERWLEEAENPTASAYYLLALASSQLKQYDKALTYAQAMMGRAKTPKESWLQLLLAIHYELGDTAEMAKVLERLVELYPKRTYWVQLSGVYSELKRDREALAVLELAYRQGYLEKEKELRNLAQLYLYNELPFEAAQVLERALRDGRMERSRENLELLSNALLRAGELERAIPPLEEAARLSNDGELFTRLAHVHIEREDWKKAIDALRTALRATSLKKPGKARLLLGIALYNDGQVAEARRTFLEARDDPEVTEDADRWLETIRRRAERSAAAVRP